MVLVQSPADLDEAQDQHHRPNHSRHSVKSRSFISEGVERSNHQYRCDGRPEISAPSLALVHSPQPTVTDVCHALNRDDRHRLAGCGSGAGHERDRRDRPGQQEAGGRGHRPPKPPGGWGPAKGWMPPFESPRAPQGSFGSSAASQPSDLPLGERKIQMAAGHALWGQVRLPRTRSTAAGRVGLYC